MDAQAGLSLICLNTPKDRFSRVNARMIDVKKKII